MHCEIWIHKGKRKVLKRYLWMLFGHMLLCILGQLYHLRIWFLHIIAVCAVH